MGVYVVAGGAGFIGCHLVERLLDRGDQVVAIDNLITGAEDNISHLYGNPNFTFINQDIIKGLPRIDAEVLGIFHLASPASPNAKSPKSYIAFPLETMLVNSLGTLHLLDLALHKGAKFLFASTSEVYGDPDVSPQKETYFGNVNPVGVRSVYDEGKRFGEALTASYVRESNVNAVIIRIFNTYGDRMQVDDGRVVSNFINQALMGDDMTIYGKGDQTRSFCFVDDLVTGLVSAMDRDTRGEVINLGNPKEFSIKELAEKVKHETGSKSKIIHEELPEDDPKQRKPDITKAKKLLGFDPKIDLDEGLKKTIEYFKSL
ncbi:MAG TPA: UDP-glucuronic acid decarboxylase family protein [Patescibacteria group bacterium]|nr:UDP-glucuronic acid decarboxylase family protein [Patescibacteria group bacterium]